MAYTKTSKKKKRTPLLKTNFSKLENFVPWPKTSLLCSTVGPHEDLEKISNCLTAMPNETS